MRKCVGTLVLVALLAGLVAVVAGCGEEEGVITTPLGELQYKEGKITVTTEDGEEEIQWTVRQAEADALGIPVPDEAELEKGSAAVVRQEDGRQAWTGATYWSDMAVDEVINFYRERLGSNTGFVDTSTKLDGDEVGLFSFEDEDSVKSVIVSAGKSGDPGKTKITMAVAKG